MTIPIVVKSWFKLVNNPLSLIGVISLMYIGHVMVVKPIQIPSNTLAQRIISQESANKINVLPVMYMSIDTKTVERIPMAGISLAARIPLVKPPKQETLTNAPLTIGVKFAGLI